MTGFFDTDDVERRQLEADLKHIVQYASDNAGRSQQAEIGPSEIGNGCDRALAYKMSGTPPVAGSDGDCLASVIGTAGHAWFEKAVHTQNKALGRIRWVAEQKVVWRTDHRPGTCDLFDLDTRSVIDAKFPGPSRLKHYKQHGPSSLYRTQVHTYGLGYEKTFGVTPRNVGIMFFGRASTLSNAFLWMERYDRSVAEAAVARIDDIARTVTELDVQHHPERFDKIPACPGEDCRFCDWFHPNPEGPLQCSGNADDTGQGRLPLAAIESLRKGMGK